MLQRFVDAASVEAEIARLRSLFGDALRRRWQSVFGRSPPDSLTPDLLRRMIAARVQEQAFGTLDLATLKLLDGLARRSDGYVWEGNPYSSLSAIARAITGTAWSGPRFFAVKSSGDRKNDPLDAARGQRRARHPTEPR